MKHLEKLTEEQLLEHAKKQMPLYRRLLARATSFLGGLFGKGRQVATAADVQISVDGMGGRQVGKLTLSNFKAPSFNKLKSHVTALQESDAIDELDYIVSRLAKSENTKMKAEAKRMLPMLVAMQEAFNDAHEALESIADKHLPAEVGNVFQAADKHVTEFMREYTGDAKVEVPANVLVGAEDDHIDFVQYFELTEFVEQRIYLMVTCSLTAVGNEYVMSTHVTSQDRFQGPMSYDIGEATQDVGKAMRQELAVQGVIVTTGAIKLKVDEKRVTNALKRLPFVTDVKVAPKAINVWVKGNKRTHDQEKEIFAIISSDSDVRTQLGRSRRLVSNFTEDKHWQFTVTARG
ncbi:hypothetical protein O152_gp293 [Pseudomonas phage PaBG]|uniref:Uncharacterized protein n=1 Tax=Pseudomonas phage PaBG TaxID=1335230 RepID=S5VME3_9CAUD|nr:hypothetical protein O152_gp293 [Pseudomonas phage PaBG]AGS82069.1 hypothetical protein PaBG_00193 [Pseudomonas phage PaBG]